MKKQKYDWKSHFYKYIEDLPLQPGGIGPLDDSMLSFFVFSAVLNTKRPVLLISGILSMAERMKMELDSLCGYFGAGGRIDELPEGSTRNQSVSESDSPRAECLYRSLTEPARIYTASLPAVLAPAPSPEKMMNSELTLQVGMEIPLQLLAGKLVEMDYDDELEVTGQGEFARRGGIIDIFSPAQEFPARVEFWGDTIDSIRLFDVSSQTSKTKVNEYRIILRSGAAAESDSEETEYDFMDYIAKSDPLVIVIHPDECRRHIEQFGTDGNLKRWDRILEEYKEKMIFLLDAPEAVSWEGNLFSPKCFPSSAHILNVMPEGAEDSFVELSRQLETGLIKQWESEGYHVVLLGQSKADVQHIKNWLPESGIHENDHIHVEHGVLPAGAFLPEEKLAILTEHELFSTPRRMLNQKVIKKEHAVRDISEEDLSSFGEIEEGDHAVHINFGICLYRGLKTITTSANGKEEVLELEFDDDAIVHIPVWQANCITKYIGSKKEAVQLSKVSSSRWSKVKAEATSKIRDLAFDMLRMQAIRSSAHGTAFPPDDLNQRLFEQAFPFQETPDQMKASEEIKHDMESVKPMDRLLCGDVGYGKTELAMRAVFKCVMSGRQAAVLVPTTILAQQHYFSFLERFAGTPIVIETLSRFKTKAEQKRIVERLREGSVDVVIGTHRIVQPDIEFKDLGLIIIDEEQRFGVMHKERLKRLRATVDVLTMTATPIPRTLYLSMAGLRDLSTLMSAPVQRLPIQTIVAQAEVSVITNAICRELQRGGQVYYLHNRVATIDEEAVRLSKLFPEARIGIGHGRLDEEVLEATMKDFIEGKLDILVCTTIIESGLDIPNANTIIIDRADRFGLAELYQLRGRVGRWIRQAYAYFLLPKSGILTGDARKRIAAIRRYTHLGAGFKLALRDMEIRGAGNILGAEQSGQINAVGFHLYCQLLRSCISQIKGEVPEKRTECALFSDFLEYTLVPEEGKIAAGFPVEYINSPRLRLEAYRRLASITSLRKLDDFAAELKDRFGKLPEITENLLMCRRIKVIAGTGMVTSISVRNDKVIIERGNSIVKPDGVIPRLNAAFSPKKKLKSLYELVLHLFHNK